MKPTPTESKVHPDILQHVKENPQYELLLKYKEELEILRRKACLRRQELARLNLLVEKLIRGKREEYISDIIDHYQSLLALLHHEYKLLWNTNRHNIEIANDYKRQRDELKAMMYTKSATTTDHITLQLGEEPELLFINELVKERKY